MNNNNENQNMNMGVPNVVPVPPEPMVGQGLTPGVPQNMGNMAGSMPQPVSTIETIPNTFEQPVNNVVPNPVPQPMEGLQLNPEGIVAPTPVNNPMPNVAEPLMGAPLNDQTVLNSGTTNMNNFGAVPPVAPPNNNTMVPPTNQMGFMGGVPAPPLPPTNNEKKNLKISKPILIVLIVVLILAVGFGIYYFLFASKKKAPQVTITPILSEVELGAEVLLDASVFAKVTGMNATNCKVDTNLDSNKAGTYTYTVTCGNKVSADNKIYVKDTQAPEVILKDLIVTPNTMVKVEDFIAEIVDASTCTSEFRAPVETKEEGEFEVDIIVTDAHGNESTATGILVVSNNAPQYYLSCEEVGITNQFENATVTTQYKYGISASGEYYNIEKNVIYQFSSEEEFLTAADTILPNEFDGVKGRVFKNIETFSIRINRFLKDDDISNEFSLSPFPTNEFEIESYHNENGGTCTILNS